MKTTGNDNAQAHKAQPSQTAPGTGNSASKQASASVDPAHKPAQTGQSKTPGQNDTDKTGKVPQPNNGVKTEAEKNAK